MTILDKVVAKKLYNDLFNLINEPNRLYYDKIIDLGVILEKIYNEITKDVLSDKEPLYDKIEYIEKNYTIPSVIIKRSHLIRDTVNNKRHKGVKPKASYYPIFIETIMDCINFYSDMSIPQELTNAYENMHTKDFNDNDEPVNKRPDEKSLSELDHNDPIKELKNKFKGDVSRDVSGIEIVDIFELVIFVVSSILLLAGIGISAIFLILDGGLFFYRWGKINHLKVIPFIIIFIHIFFGVIVFRFSVSYMFGGFMVLGTLITLWFHWGKKDE